MKTNRIKLKVTHKLPVVLYFWKNKKTKKERSPSRLTQQVVMRAGTKHTSQIIVLQTLSLLTMLTLAVIVLLSHIMKCRVLGQG